MLVIDKDLNIDTFNLQAWDYQNRAYFRPAIWDAIAAPSGMFQSGIGYSPDVGLINITNEWKPVLRSGHYFIHENRYFLIDPSRAFDSTRVLTVSSITSVNGYGIFNITVPSFYQAYAGKFPVYLMNFQRRGDTLVPYKEYRQVRLFSHIDHEAVSGYIDPSDVVGYSNTSTSDEFMISRCVDEETFVTVTGITDFGYNEYHEPRTVNVSVVMSNVTGFAESVSCSYTLKNIEDFIKLPVVPVASITSVILDTPSGSIDITSRQGTEDEVISSGWALADGLPGVVKFYNRGTAFEDSMHPLYTNSTITITYVPGLWFSYNNSYNETVSPNITLNPLTVGSDRYNLLLTNTEIDPTRIRLTSAAKKCYVAGHPISMKIACSFNEAPILNYPVSIQAGISRLAFNNLVLYGQLDLRTDGYGKASCIYVPPKSLDDETFYANLGHHIPVIDLGTITNLMSWPQNGMYGVGSYNESISTSRNTIFFPTPKYAKSLMSSTLYAIYDKDMIRNNDFISGWGTLLIKGYKRPLVQSAYASNAAIDASKSIGRSIALSKRASDMYMSEIDYKFRTNSSGGLALYYRPYSTRSESIYVYVNDVLAAIKTRDVPENTYGKELESVDLNYRYVVNELHTATGSLVYSNYIIVSGTPNGELVVSNSDGSTVYTEGVDYTYTPYAIQKLTISASSPIKLSYTTRANLVHTDTVNIVRFLIEDMSIKVNSWDIVDVTVDRADSLLPYDNEFCPAKPIAFFVLDSLNRITLKRPFELNDVDMAIGCVYYRLPHTVRTSDNIIGYYIYTPGIDFVHASAWTSYGKHIVSNPVGITVDVPDYMKGLVQPPAKSYTSLSPYSAGNYFQLVD